MLKLCVLLSASAVAGFGLALFDPPVSNSFPSALPADTNDQPSSVAAVQPPATGTTSARRLAALGLPPERLLACGLTVPQIAAAAQRLRDAGSQTAAFDAAQAQLAALQRQIAIAGRAPDQEAAAQSLANLEASAASVRQQVYERRAALRNLVLADCTSAQLGLLSRSLKGQGFGLDPALALAAPSEAAMRRVASALVAENRAQRTGDDVATECRELLAAARADTAVVDAASRLLAQRAALWATLSQPVGLPSAPTDP